MWETWFGIEMRYYSANDYYKDRFGCKMYKAAISLPVTCPNRDGSKGVGGCAFCSGEGSGEFASLCNISVVNQIDLAIDKLKTKTDEGTGFIAYFQSFTNTYCEVGFLEDAISQSVNHPRVRAISIATRPDCISDKMIKMLSRINKICPIFVELGLQTSNDEIAYRFNRCFFTQEYDDTIIQLKEEGINVITHVIFGLEGDTIEGMLDTVNHVVECKSDGIKFTCLFVLKGTRYEELYNEGKLSVLEMQEYFDIVDKALELLPKDMVVHRLTGDGPKSSLIAPMWTWNKRNVVNYINKRFK